KLTQKKTLSLSKSDGDGDCVLGLNGSSTVRSRESLGYRGSSMDRSSASVCFWESMEAKGSFCRAISFRSRKRFEKSREDMIFVLFKTKSTMITNEFGEILHRYIYMGFRKALKFHQFYFGDEFQNLTAVKLEENDKLQKVLEEIKEEDKDIEDAEGKEVTEEELSEQTEGSGCFVFSFLISSLRSFSYFILVISWLHGLIFLPLRSLYTILIWNKNGFFGFWYYYVLVFKSNEVISKSMELEGGIDEHIENENVENGAWSVRGYQSGGSMIVLLNKYSEMVQGTKKGY
ncbi:hypothetical protein HID58_034047, partial [Brassica napus]